MICRVRLKSFFALFCLAGLLLTSAGCTVPLAPEQSDQASQLSVVEKRRLGERIYLQFVQQMGGVYPDRALNSYVDYIGQQLVMASLQPEFEYRFQVINDSAPYAFSLPGGFVGISRGLMVNLQTDAQLAAVLGSEIGHNIAGHDLTGMSLEGGRVLPVELADDLSSGSDYSALVNRLPQAGGDLVEKPYSLEQEMAADRIGIDLLAAAGYLPSAAIEVQEYFLDQREKDQEPSELDGPRGRHLYSIERLQSAQNYIRARYPQSKGRSGDKEFSAAVEALRLINPGYVDYDLGRQLERQGQPAEAIEAYHRALQIAPDEALILAGLGLAYLRNEDPVPARRYLLKAVNLQDDYAQSRLGLGYVYLQKWQYAQAISQLEKSLQLLPTVEAAFLLAEAQQKVGQQVKARDLYLIVASVDGNGKLGRLAKDRLQQLKGE